jgi:hypothetical protein
VLSSTGTGKGVLGTSNSSTGMGVMGWNKSTTGQAIGVYGVSDSATGAGVFGRATEGSGANAGVYGTAFSDFGYGVLGSSVDNIGVKGEATSTVAPNYGVYGTTPSRNGRGVYGLASASNGTAYGGYFQSNADQGAAVYGKATSLSTLNGLVQYGGLFIADGPNGRGVWGIHSNSAAGGAGVVGQNSNGFGVFAYGDMGCSGNKSFQIDHPLDPENKYLRHYCAEGPEPRNVYQGHVTTGANGYAWIDLPDYFNEINRDPEYTLTVIDSSDDFVLAKVTHKVEANRFQIRTSKPGVLVSWRVEGIRNDLWVQRHGAPVEVDKEGWEKGKYQHPELYGAGRDMGLNRVPDDPPARPGQR